MIPKIISTKRGVGNIHVFQGAIFFIRFNRHLYGLNFKYYKPTSGIFWQNRLYVQGTISYLLVGETNIAVAE